jgi:hypothetical protein
MLINGFRFKNGVAAKNQKTKSHCSLCAFHSSFFHGSANVELPANAPELTKTPN